jgi:hypothetical protein
MNIHMPNANLLLPAAELGDADQITARILDEAPVGADPKSVRDVAVRHLLALKSDVNMRLAAAYLASPLVARPLLSAQSFLTDVMVTVALLVMKGHPVLVPARSASR